MPRARVQAGWVGDELAETYVRLLAEAELRRAADRLRQLDSALGTDWSDPGMEPFQVSEMAQWRVIRAGRILAAAGALDQDFLDRFSYEVSSAIMARSRIHLTWYRRGRVLHRVFTRESGQARLPERADETMWVTPIGRTFGVPHERRPSALHLMSLVRTRTDAMITLVRRAGSPDSSVAPPRVTEIRPCPLPYSRVEAVDEHGTRYQVRLEGGQGGTASWLGVARLSPVPPSGLQWLDLAGDGTRLIRLPLWPSAARGGPAAPRTAEPAAASPGERLLLLEAERILATADGQGPVQGPVPGEIISVLTQTGAIAAESQVPGQLAALCQRLGAAGHGITVPPASQLPAPWASVIARRGVPLPAHGREVFAPLAQVFDVDGARFALAGLSTAAGQSYLHVVGSGAPQLTERFSWNWQPGFSWWLTDGAGNWHVATASEPWTTSEHGTQAYRLQLTPPLGAVPKTAEVVVTGPATRVRLTVPIGPAPATGGPPARGGTELTYAWRGRWASGVRRARRC